MGDVLTLEDREARRAPGEEQGRRDHRGHRHPQTPSLMFFFGSHVPPSLAATSVLHAQTLSACIYSGSAIARRCMSPPLWFTDTSLSPHLPPPPCLRIPVPALLSLACFANLCIWTCDVAERQKHARNLRVWVESDASCASLSHHHDGKGSLLVASLCMHTQSPRHHLLPPYAGFTRTALCESPGAMCACIGVTSSATVAERHSGVG